MQPGQHITPTIRIVRRLSEGNMGSVWVADHLALGAQIAVKFIAAKHANDEEFIARFRKEASAAARIRSPHVAQVFDHGVSDLGAPYIVMELLEGETLQARLRRLGALPIAEVVQVVHQVTRALSRAHGIGIIHRDIKPDNLFVLDLDGEPFVKVLDFGIAKQIDLGDPAVSNGMTLTHMLLGTPLYMSPEQFLSAKRVDHRADLWSLGVVVYQALTGKLPFIAETLPALGAAVHAGHFAPPSAHRPELPAAVDAWMARALHKDLASRFGTARELAEALEKASHGARRSTDRHAAEPRPKDVAETLAAPRPSKPNPTPPPPPPSRPSSKSPPPPPPRRDRISAGSARILQVRKGRILVMRGDIAEAGTEAIVSPADPTLSGVSGLVARAILRAAGRELLDMLSRVGTCPPGSAVLTPAGKIPAPTRFILHAVGPSYDPQRQIACAAVVKSAHDASLRLAEENGIRTIAFPAISRNLDPYPNEKLAPIAISAAIEHLASSARSVESITFILLTHGSYQSFSAALAARSKG